jgi:hypothetical protein
LCAPAGVAIRGNFRHDIGVPRPTDTIRHLAIACGAMALFVGGVWIAVQGGFALPAPGKFAAVISIVLDSLPTLAALAAGVIGLGLPVRFYLARSSRHPHLIQCGGGLAVLLLGDWALACLGLLNGYTAWGLCAAGALLLGRQAAGAGRELFDVRHWPNPPWTLLAGLPLLGLYLAACTCPPGSMWLNEANGFDVLSYHLQLPRQWLEAGRMTGLHHNVYSYLPNLVEAGSMQALALRRGALTWVYTAQFFHAGMAMLAASVIGSFVSRCVGRAAGVAAAVAFLALPWALITGTLAYDEMAALTFGALALVVLFDGIGSTARGALLAGLLCGASLLAKLSCGILIAPPVAAIALLGLNREAGAVIEDGSGPRVSRTQLWACRSFSLTGCVVLGVAVILTPYLVRNACWTGNPVFPFATGLLGRGHWSADSAARWQAVHQPAAGAAESLEHLLDRVVTSTGFGAVGGSLRQLGTPAQESRDIARFDFQGGVPVLWLGALAGAAILYAWRPRRRLALAMLLMLTIQVVIWLLCTHQQSRFLLPAAIPACILLGVGAGRLEQLLRYRSRIVYPGVVLLVTGALVITSFLVYLGQTRRWDMERREWIYLPTATPIASLEPHIPPPDLAAGRFEAPGDHVLNSIPDLKRVLLIADTQSLLYIRVPMAYNITFDSCVLGDLIRAHGTDPRALARGLREMGFSHLWVNWSELHRLTQTRYGYDPAVTPATVAGIVRSWREYYRAPPPTPLTPGEPVPPPRVSLYVIPELPAGN